MLIPIYSANFMKYNCQFILVFYEMDFMMSLSDDKQADIIDAFNNIHIFG